MHIGIVPTLNTALGGVYQYSITMLHALADWEANDHTQLVVFASDVRHPSLARLRPPTWTIRPLDPPTRKARGVHALRRLAGEGVHRQAWRWIRQKLTPLRPVHRPDPDRVNFRADVHRWFRDCSIDLMLYPTPTPLSFEAGIPYVMAIHDLQHKLQPQFPEVSSDGEWESREYYFRNGSRYATLLLADSEVGKEDILNCYGRYGVTADRVKVLPFLPASYLAVDVEERERQFVRTTYHLPPRYLFYPAQFWPHKNHINVVHALGLLKQQYGVTIPVVFCGWHSGKIRERVFQEIMTLAARTGVAGAIHYLGFVPDENMSGLYAEAAALVMPTFFGPTNIPILEAWSYGCPVVTSDIRGVRDQVQDAAVLVDPTSPEAIAHGIYSIWTDESLRVSLVERARRRLATYTPADYRRRLSGILEEAKARISSERPRILAR